MYGEIDEFDNPVTDADVLYMRPWLGAWRDAQLDASRKLRDGYLEGRHPDADMTVAAYAAKVDRAARFQRNYKRMSGQEPTEELWERMDRASYPMAWKYVPPADYKQTVRYAVERVLMNAKRGMAPRPLAEFAVAAGEDLGGGHGPSCSSGGGGGGRGADKPKRPAHWDVGAPSFPPPSMRY